MAQATKGQSRLLSGQIGAGFSFAKPDFGPKYIKGFSGYADFDIHNRIGIEADVQFDNIFTPTDIGQKSYMLGPRFVLVRQGMESRPDFMKFYVKATGGLAQFQYQQGRYRSTGDDNYAAFALGGGIDLHVAPHLNVRAGDIEWQDWPSFYNKGLTPITATFGAAYSF